mmetsp:Transcript_10510/g.42427  ORF Transcript_10510/g.42427 Transcript_10510/m.42427 type:complete len:241 (+) Transcript_10510:659-1381(+)
MGFVHPGSGGRGQAVRVAVRELHEHPQAPQRGGVRLFPGRADAGEDHGAQERAQHGLSPDPRALRVCAPALAAARADSADASDAPRVPVVDPARVHLRIHAAGHPAQAIAQSAVPQRRHTVPGRDWRLGGGPKVRLALCQALRHRHRAAPADFAAEREDRRGVRQRQRRRAGVHPEPRDIPDAVFQAPHRPPGEDPGVPGAPAHRTRVPPEHLLHRRTRGFQGLSGLLARAGVRPVPERR